MNTDELLELAYKEADENFVGVATQHIKVMREALWDLNALMTHDESAIVQWGFKWGQKVSDAVSSVCACINKCSHCCRRCIYITRAEAIEISKFTGRKITESFTGRLLPESIDIIQELQKKYAGAPCVFLKDGSCSIYEVRPIECRLQVNISNQIEICDLVKHPATKVPYVSDGVHIAVLSKLGSAQPSADIREWFPEEVN